MYLITLLTLGMLVTSIPCFAGMFAPMPEDYILHFLSGAVIQGVLDNYYPDYRQNWYIVCGIGITKELWDCTHGGYFDIAEAGATMLGGAFMENMEQPR